MLGCPPWGAGQITDRHSLRLLVAGHVESPTVQDDYLIDRLDPVAFREAGVYASPPSRSTSASPLAT